MNEHEVSTLPRGWHETTAGTGYWDGERWMLLPPDTAPSAPPLGLTIGIVSGSAGLAVALVCATTFAARLVGL